ncbi:zinc finger protein 3-like [Cydia strobilella]|uniref:zinc finger protein 3-like n=1 Tax=Cydia strobilella TaxID=1100964 RepID=UPI0030056731
MSLDRRIKEEPDLKPDQVVYDRVLVEDGVMVYIKEEPPGSDSEGSDVTPTSPQNHAVMEHVLGSESLQQPKAAHARETISDVATVRVKQEPTDQEDLTQEISPGVVYQIKVERVDKDTVEGLKSSVVERVADPTEARKEGGGQERGEEARTDFKVHDESAAKASAKRQQKKRKTKDNADTSTRSRKERQPGPHLCDVCNKEFRKANKLLIHKRTHTGERPYTCNICHKQFSYSNGLKVHLRTHTGEKPHVCQTCNKKFGQWSSLKVHERIHTGEKPYSCEICKKEFAQLNNLNKHQLVHSEIKQYSCEVCKKEFKDNNSLKRHEPIHIDEKLFPCGKCKKHFATPRHLRDHERAHTRKRKRYSSATS